MPLATILLRRRYALLASPKGYEDGIATYEKPPLPCGGGGVIRFVRIVLRLRDQVFALLGGSYP